MYRFVEWENLTKTGNDIATEFINLAKLNSIDAKIIEDRRDRIPQYRTAMNINMSVEYITKRIKNYLIPKYKKISNLYPDILPSIDKNKNYEYSNIECVVNIIVNNQIYSIQIKNKNFQTFADIRLYVIEEIEKKYNIKLDHINNYETYISGKYNRKIDI